MKVNMGLAGWGSIWFSGSHWVMCCVSPLTGQAYTPLLLSTPAL